MMRRIKSFLRFLKRGPWANLYNDPVYRKISGDE